MCNPSDQVCEYRTGCQWFHDISHCFNSEEQKTKGKNRLADTFYFLWFCYKWNQKSYKNNHINIVTDLKRNNLCCHGCTNICTKNDGNCLWQVHQSRTYETDRHNCRRTAALEYRGCERTGKHTQKRILRQKCKNAFHFIARRLLQTFTHHIHSIDKNCQTAKQSENDLNFLVHINSSLNLPCVC